MRAIHFYIILFLIGIGFSCKKKTYPESTSQNDVVYYFNATVNNHPVSLEAGKDDYYMYTSLLQDANGVYNFSANLTKPACINCTNNSLAIEITDFKVSTPGATVVIDSAFQVRSYPILSPTVSAYSVKFKSSYTMQGSDIPGSYSWDFGDGNKSTDIDPVHVYEKSGIYNVCLSVTGLNGCVSSICNLQKIGLDGNPCKTSINATAVTGNVVQFTPTTTGSVPYEYFWDFGDGSPIGTAANPTHTYATPGGRTVKLTVKDVNNDVAIASYNVITTGDPSSCAANYQVVSITPVSGTQTVSNYSKVTINWRDASGTLYTSRSLLQPLDSYFRILSIEDYEINENGLKTKKLHVQFKCRVYNGNDSILIDNADAVISVAYK